jgi:hypothetical protein
VLLVAAGLLAQSLNKADNVDMKLDATNRYIAHINPQAPGYKNTEVEPLPALRRPLPRHFRRSQSRPRLHAN